jgi:hypothetical protein
MVQAWITPLPLDREWPAAPGIDHCLKAVRACGLDVDER